MISARVALSSVTSAFYCQVVQENRIPRTLSYGERGREVRRGTGESDRIASCSTACFGDADFYVVIAQS